MNFLAHLFLADDTPESMIGNILPDLVRGPLPPRLSPEVLRGARMHQRVDAFTDTHPVFGRSKQRISHEHGIFSGILIDMFYDHFLARAWHDFHPDPLEVFTGYVHEVFAANAYLMPERMAGICARMREQNWLNCYGTYEGLELTLRRMSERFSDRLRRDVDLARGLAELADYDEVLEADFREFFPQLIAFASQQTGAEPVTTKESSI